MGLKLFKLINVLCLVRLSNNSHIHITEFGLARRFRNVYDVLEPGYTAFKKKKDKL